ncbi:MAG TPA: GLPGLI family protein [Flavobacteriaceae bacterium]|nr:GLPGLI family protein [Flavobacteriaceae bacterium]
MLRKFLYLFLFLILPNLSFSQTKGRIVYKEALKLNEIDDSSRIKNGLDFLNRRKELRARIPLNLDFDKQESVFYADTRTNVGISNEPGYEAAIKSFNSYYRNESTKTAIEQIISERTYLVESKTSDIVWNITNEQKTIDNYPCIKATTTVLAYHITKGVYERTIEAWFTPSIALSLGPRNFGGLPGLILELVYDGGKLTYYVESINLDPDFELEVKKPTRGKTISREDYYEMRPKITRENLKEFIGG